MIRAGNELMKIVREKLKLSQEEMGEHLHMTQRTVSRIETGKRNLGVWEYFSLMEMAGKPTEDVSPLILESRELKDYSAYRELKRLLRDARFLEAKEILHEFEKGTISKQPFILQFIAFANIYVDEEMPHQEAIDKLYEILRMSINDFETCNIPAYRLTFNEIYIICAIAMRLECVGKIDCSIILYKALVDSRGNALATCEDKATLYPALMYNLSRLLGVSGMHKESLSYSKDAYGLCIKYDNLRLVPKLLYNMACSNRLLGEEEKIFQTYFIRAYHTAHALQNHEIIDISKREANKFGLSDL